MITKYEVDEQKEDKETIKELVAKVNEVIAAANTPPSVGPPRREVTTAECVVHLVSFGQRMRSGPLQLLCQKDSGPLVKAIDDAFTTFQNAVAAYKKSIEG